MGCKIGFSSCNTGKKFSKCIGVRFSSCDSKPKETQYNLVKEMRDVNPNKFRYKIEEFEILNANTIVLVHYLDCTTFKGRKLLLLKGKHDPRNFSELDPHFLDDDHLVIARFIPNEDGYNMARASAMIF